MRHLGIDFGTKKIGLALSDENGTMGFPHAIVPNDGRLIDTILELVERKEVGVVVIGESKNLNGEDNAVAKDAKAFGQLLERRSGLIVHFEPEIYTTQEARRDPEGVWLSDSAPVDASAAALILTSYLSRTHGTN